MTTKEISPYVVISIYTKAATAATAAMQLLQLLQLLQLCRTKCMNL
jgi:hypothetical protein